jgi:hypothetical protein
MLDLLEIFDIRPDLKRERVLTLHRCWLIYAPSPLLLYIVVRAARPLLRFSFDPTTDSLHACPVSRLVRRPYRKALGDTAHI